MQIQSLSFLGLSCLLAIGFASERAIALATNASRIANGQILQVRGEVSIQRQDGRVVQPTRGTLLYEGDRLRTGPNASALLQCADKSRMINSIGANSDRLNRCAKATEEEECDANLVRCPARGDDIVWSNEPIPYVVFPQRTKLLENRPEIRWRAVEGADNYTVVLQKDGEDEWVLENVTPTPIDEELGIPFPEDRAPLELDAEYEFVIETDTGRSSQDFPLSVGDSTHFELLGASDRAKIQTELNRIASQPWDEGAKLLARANLYVECGAVALAIETLEEMESKNLATAATYRIKGDLHWNLVSIRRARKAYERALERAIATEDFEEKVTALDGLGQTLLQLGKKQEALQLLVEARMGYEDLNNLERSTELEMQLRRLQLKSVVH